jgi:hypothetical protein
MWRRIAFYQSWWWKHRDCPKRWVTSIRLLRGRITLFKVEPVAGCCDDCADLSCSFVDRLTDVSCWRSHLSMRCVFRQGGCLNVAVLLDIMPCGLLEMSWRFDITAVPSFQGHFYPECGERRFHWHRDTFLPDYTVLHPRRRLSGILIAMKT